MAEIMTSESIVEAEWLLKGYWTKLRFAFQTEKGGWSDVDILAYHPETRRLIISESKVRGPKDHVYAYTEHTKKAYGSIIEYDEDNYFSFLRHLPKLCKNRVIFDNFPRMVKRLTVQLVCNYSVARDVAMDVTRDFHSAVQRYKLPVKSDVQLDTTIDVVARVIQAERESKQGRRYGHPILDVAREINRYFFPKIRYAGRSADSTKRVQQEAVGTFLRAIGLESSSPNRVRDGV